MIVYLSTEIYPSPHSTIYIIIYYVQLTELFFTRAKTFRFSIRRVVLQAFIAVRSFLWGEDGAIGLLGHQ